MAPRRWCAASRCGDTPSPNVNPFARGDRGELGGGFDGRGPASTASRARSAAWVTGEERWASPGDLDPWSLDTSLTATSAITTVSKRSPLSPPSLCPSVVSLSLSLSEWPCAAAGAVGEVPTPSWPEIALPTDTNSYGELAP